jgi:hypothetical protein
MSIAEIDFTINGTQIPIMSFDISGGSHGAAGSAQFNTSIKMLQEVGFDLAGESTQSSSPLPVQCSVETNNGGGLIFVGEYITGKWDYPSDEVMMHCRDLGGKMVDEKRVLAPGSAATGGVTTQNQTINNYVSQIAAGYGLTPNINVTDNEFIGRLFGDTTTTVLTSIPQTFWGFLTKLARDTGYEMCVSPQGQLIFATPGQNGSGLTFSWGIPNSTGGGSSYPLLSLHIEHNPARNHSHTTTVNSYDPTHAQVTKGVKQVGSANQRYTFHTDGLTQAQAQKKAESISKDISKREVVITTTSDFIPSVQALQGVTLNGNVDPYFLNLNYYINQFSHQFSMGRGDGKKQGDLFTSTTLYIVGDT